MPSPVMRIAPKPSRLTARSPPNRKTELSVATGDEFVARIIFDPPANREAPPISVVPRNLRRVTRLLAPFSLSITRSVCPWTQLSTRRQPTDGWLRESRALTLKEECAEYSQKRISGFIPVAGKRNLQSESEI